MTKQHNTQILTLMLLLCLGGLMLFQVADQPLLEAPGFEYFEYEEDVLMMGFLSVAVVHFIFLDTNPVLKNLSSALLPPVPPPPTH